MSATTTPTKRTGHNPAGKPRVKPPIMWLFFGGIVFVAAWLVWVFWLSSAIGITQ